ncbi:hypothetical protein llap_1888 [Limosa lapponica baueri]|uniref:Uncharacterized protein n=1 Tax=Limosa lapponica baueri TaxID=1758121 RepID=A0A2I0UP14_LIMLA|nr:hypothetical protein llap_1888 [Limosa lapponica baueri]
MEIISSDINEVTLNLCQKRGRFGIEMEDMIKRKDPGDFDPASGLKVVGDHTGHKKLPQEDPLFLWDDINSNKEYLAQAV